MDIRKDSIKLYRRGAKAVVLLTTEPENRQAYHSKWMDGSDEYQAKEFDRMVLGELETHSTACALDIADEGGATLDQIAAPMGLTRERVRQIESKSLLRLKALGVARPDMARTLAELMERNT